MEQFYQHQLVYIDETGIDVYLDREKGRALKAEKVKTKIRRYLRLSLVAVQAGKKLIVPMTYTGTMISDLFESWFRDFLLPLLTKKSLIIMDNARFHRMSTLQDLVAATEHIILPLPPDLSSIEKT